jgi:hypothetical protein
VKEKNLSSNFVDNDPAFSSHHINKKPTLSDLHFSPLEEEPLTPEEINRAKKLDHLRKQMITCVKNLDRAHRLPEVGSEEEYSIMVDFLLSSERSLA